MKKLILPLLMLFVLTGCGEDEVEPTPTEVDAPEVSTPEIDETNDPVLQDDLDSAIEMIDGLESL